MTLDNNTQQFSDAIRAASERLNIAAIYIEKDYWITKILQQLSRTPQANNIVWKGGTSLSKGYGLIDRFSSDIDVAVLADGMNGNQIKTLISKVEMRCKGKRIFENHQLSQAGLTIGNERIAR